MTRSASPPPNCDPVPPARDPQFPRVGSGAPSPAPAHVHHLPALGEWLVDWSFALGPEGDPVRERVLRFLGAAADALAPLPVPRTDPTSRATPHRD